MAAPSFNAFHDFEHAGWQKAAEQYGRTFGTLTAQASGPLLDEVAVRAGARVLDVASGPGYVAGLAAAQGARVIGRRLLAVDGRRGAAPLSGCRVSRG